MPRELLKMCFPYNRTAREVLWDAKSSKHFTDRTVSPTIEVLSDANRTAREVLWDAKRAGSVELRPLLATKRVTIT